MNKLLFVSQLLFETFRPHLFFPCVLHFSAYRSSRDGHSHTCCLFPFSECTEAVLHLYPKTKNSFWAGCSTVHVSPFFQSALFGLGVMSLLTLSTTITTAVCPLSFDTLSSHPSDRPTDRKLRATEKHPFFIPLPDSYSTVREQSFC